VAAEEIGARHLRVCARFGEVVGAATGRWTHASPCATWDARAVLEHVIGFHDVLLLRPLGAKPDRPRDDPELRWLRTYDALDGVFSRAGIFEGIVEVPAVGKNAPTQIDARRLVPALTQDVLVHAWDLARAVGADDHLDADLCARFLAQLPSDPAVLTASGMYEAPIDTNDDASVQSRLLARLGRDPAWSPDRTRPDSGEDREP